MLSFRGAESFAIGEESRGNVLRSDWSPPRSALRCARFNISASLVASFLIAGVTTIDAQEKPIQIGVLALGPRYMPEWTCGQASYRPDAGKPRQDTTPVYVFGLVDGLSKLKYVEDKPENAGKPGRRFVLNVRTGNSQQLRLATRELVAKPVDFIVAIATA